MSAEMLYHKLGVNLILEPVLALHGFHEAVGNAVGHHELEILALVVVLEVVVVLVLWYQATRCLRSNVEIEREVELVVVNFRIIRHSPIQIEGSVLAELIMSHVKLVDLII